MSAASITDAKLDQAVKSTNSQPEAAKKLGLTVGQLGMLRYGQSLVRVGKLAKAPATEASAKKLRQGGMRLEFISAATGLSLAKVKEHVGDIQIARGRKAGSTNGGATKAASAKSGVQVTTGRGRGKSTPAKTGRARTRAERAAKSGNPS